VLFKTKDEYLKIKKCEFLEYYYIEKKGIDNISVVLFDKDTNQIGLINEGKLAFNERDNVDLSFKTSSINGSLFEDITEKEYLSLNFNEQLDITKEITIKKIHEKCGYEIQKLNFINRNIFSYNKNEYVWSFIAEVDRYSNIHKDVEDEISDVYTTLWFNFEDLSLLEDGKFKAILFDYFIQNKMFV